ncbi:MAG: RNA-binding protein [Bacilli bacterium]|nr:RNA-binding protein [Bacilli bacterium]
MKEKLLVDGYNVIGAWAELSKLKRHNLELARDRLLEILQEYQTVSGKQTIVVFDAYLTPGARSFVYKGRLQVVFTKEDETADELIERLVYEALRDKYIHIWVVTDDAIERQVTFGEGALRIATGELRRMIEDSKAHTRRRIEQLKDTQTRNSLADHLDQKVIDLLEKWRRK